MQNVLNGPLTSLYVREAVSACREVSSFAIQTICKALRHATSNSSKFSHALTEELLKQYHSVSSGELKNLSWLLIEILVIWHFSETFCRFMVRPSGSSVHLICFVFRLSRARDNLRELIKPFMATKKRTSKVF